MFHACRCSVRVSAVLPVISNHVCRSLPKRRRLAAALARAGPISKTAGADGNCSRCSGKVPALHHAAAGKIQAVEDDGVLRHPAVRALVRASLGPRVLNERGLFKLTHYPTASIL